MKRLIIAVALLVASPALAEGEFAAGSKAKSWNLQGQENALFEGKVVDALCALTGDCPTDCGAPCAACQVDGVGECSGCISIPKGTFSSGETITVTWSGIPNPKTRDWVWAVCV